MAEISVHVRRNYANRHPDRRRRRARPEPLHQGRRQPAEAHGWEVLGIRQGWAGLLHYDLDDTRSQTEWVEPLTGLGVRTIDRYGGTHLHTSRTNPQKVRPADLPAFLADEYPLRRQGPGRLHRTRALGPRAPRASTP